MTNVAMCTAVVCTLPFGLIATIAEVVAPHSVDTLIPLAQLGSSLSLIGALIIALRYQTARTSELLSELKSAHAERIKALDEDKAYYRQRYEIMQEQLLKGKVSP